MPEVMYNGVVLPYCKTTQFSQNAYYDNATTWYRQDFSLAVETYFTADYLQLLAPRLTGRTTSAADIMSAIRSSLLVPRRPFSVRCAGVDVLPRRQQGLLGTVDAANGPQPQYCNVMQVNDATFIVEWAVKASYWENTRVALNPGGTGVTITNRVGNPVLTNTWSETQSIDEAMYTTRTREGKYIIRSDNNAGLIVDRFRAQMAILGVPAGFLRQSSSYTVSPDGLSLSYRIVDVEQFKMPPDPAYMATGSYTEQTLKYGGQRWGEVRMTLRGPKTADQGKMIRAVLGIASEKLRANGAQMIHNIGGPEDPIRRSIMEQCHLTVDMYQNVVSIVMRARMLESRIFRKDQENPNRAKYWGWNEADLAFTPGSDGQDTPRTIDYPIGGTTTGPNNRMLLQAAAYYDPSLVGIVVDSNTGQFNGGRLEVGQAGRLREP